MATILSVETATNICSVAIAKDGELMALYESTIANSHASLLTVFIEQALKNAKCQIKDIDAFAVSKGPGSYTGLRIGVSAIKGIAYGANKPVIAISTLQALAYGAGKNLPRTVLGETPYIVPMVDARRMEVYAAFYGLDNEQVREIKAEIIDESSYTEVLQEHKLIFVGNGAQKCSEVIAHTNAIFLNNVRASAAHMVEIAESAYLQGNFEDTAYFEPYYLKDFIATVPKNKVLGQL